MGADENGEAPDGGGDKRLDSLEDRLRKAHHIEAERTGANVPPNPFAGKGVSQGNRVLSALIGTPLGGLIIGYAIDQLLGTRPKAMLALLFLGIVAAFVQIWRISKERAE